LHAREKYMSGKQDLTRQEEFKRATAGEIGRAHV
jgi:hypothetical protein